MQKSAGRAIVTTLQVFLLLNSCRYAFGDPDGIAPVPSRHTPQWNVNDLLAEESADESDWKISPDSRWAAWVKNAPDPKRNLYSDHLFLSCLTEPKELPLSGGTNGFNEYDSLKWSPDGHWIGFISKSRIWLMDPFHNSLQPLTDGKEPVIDFDWQDARSVIYSVREPASSGSHARHGTEDSAQVVDDSEYVSRMGLFKINLDSRETVPLRNSKDRIHQFAVSPNGGLMVTVEGRTPRYYYDKLNPPETFLTDLKTGERKRVFTELQFPPMRLYWQRNGRGIYAVTLRATSSRYDYPYAIGLSYYDTATGRSRPVDLSWDKGLATTSIALTGDGFIAPLADGVHPKHARYRLDGDTWRRDWLTGFHMSNVFGCQLGNDDRTFLYDFSDAAHPSQWYLAALHGDRVDFLRQLTNLNPQYQNKPKARCEIEHWKGALGETVEGLLYYPLDYQAGKKYPLLVDIHGGPEALWDDRWPVWLYNHNLLASRGMFVFRPNYHGSAGYGLKRAESIIGRFGELEVEDINKGVDYLIDRGLADPNKLAVMGWSNGGTLTAAVTVSTNRYKAAIAGAAPVDWIDYWAKSGFGAWFCGSYFGKSPLNDPATLILHSPFYQLSKVTTPTLIFHGTDDATVPVDQGWMYYRGLQQTGKTNVRFIVFSGEGHDGPQKLSNERRLLNEELAWLNEYVLN